MEKTILFILLSSVFFLSCNIEKQKPQFRGIENVNVKSLQTTLTEVSADVVVYNPNSVSIKLNRIEIDVFANEIKLSHISQTKSVSIEKKSEHKIPIKSNINLIDLIQNESSILNIINSSLSGFQEKKVNLDFVGTSEFEIAGLKFVLPIKYQEVIELNK